MRWATRALIASRTSAPNRLARASTIINARDRSSIARSSSGLRSRRDYSRSRLIQRTRAAQPKPDLADHVRGLLMCSLRPGRHHLGCAGARTTRRFCASIYPCRRSSWSHARVPEPPRSRLTFQSGVTGRRRRYGRPSRAAVRAQRRLRNDRGANKRHELPPPHSPSSLGFSRLA
jgi:hypothetical protein